jgi:hypothetical protein
VARGVQSLLIAVPEAAVFRAGAPILQLRVWQQWQQLLRSKTKRTLADPATYAVTHKSAPAPGSDSKHDYYSLAPYWWPVGPRQVRISAVAAHRGHLHTFSLSGPALRAIMCVCLCYLESGHGERSPLRAS